MPAYHIKTQAEIEAMRRAGKILAQILRELCGMTRPGITTKDLDTAAEALMKKINVLPSFKGYRGYPAVICTNVNEVVVHGIPDDRKLKEGDIISIDGGVVVDGFHSDAAITVGVGKISDEARKFIQTTKEALQLGIAQAKPGKKTGDIGFAVQRHMEKHGYSVSRDFVGHGIGRRLHEPPEVPNFGPRGKGALLVPGMTIAIEPIVMTGQRYTKILEDGWTVVTKDGSLGGQEEHTILITPEGNEILTL